MNDRTDEPSWGVRINTRWQHGARGCPAWANPAQREKWGQTGVILWDHPAQQITRLLGGQALNVLDYLRTHEDWREHGVVVGEPATRLVLNAPEREPETVLTNKISLDPAQTQELLELLQGNENELQRMAEAEEEERLRVLADAYRYILTRAQRRRQREEDAP